jgi:uncharacterized phage-associated protein
MSIQRLPSLKALQSIAVLFHEEGTREMDRLRILKLLYIVERETLQETGRRFLPCRLVALDHGPLHSAVYDLIKGQHPDEQLFYQFFSKHGYRVVLNNDPGISELSRFELEKLRRVVNRYLDLASWDLAHGITHEFSEWKNNYQADTSSEIDLTDLLKSVGREAELETILQDYQERQQLQNCFDQIREQVPQ